jgi:hypothetical protein
MWAAVRNPIPAFGVGDEKEEISMTHRIALQNVVQLTPDTRQ